MDGNEENDITKIAPYESGIDMDKPGVQDYYNSVLELMAKWGVDFIKYKTN